MIHEKYPEMVNGWSKAFWVRGYYVATVGNITEILGIARNTYYKYKTQVKHDKL